MIINDSLCTVERNRHSFCEYPCYINVHGESETFALKLANIVNYLPTKINFDLVHRKGNIIRLKFVLIIKAKCNVTQCQMH